MGNKDELFLGGDKIKSKNFSNSSTILRAEYDSSMKRLVVLFVGGSTYQYSGIPEELVDGLFSSLSPGKYLNDEIKKGAYIFKKI